MLSLDYAAPVGNLRFRGEEPLMGLRKESGSVPKVTVPSGGHSWKRRRFPGAPLGYLNLHFHSLDVLVPNSNRLTNLGDRPLKGGQNRSSHLLTE